MNCQFGFKKWSMFLVCLLSIGMILGCQTKNTESTDSVSEIEKEQEETVEAPDEVVELEYHGEALSFMDEISGEVSAHYVQGNRIYAYTSCVNQNLQESESSTLRECLYAFDLDGSNPQTIFVNDGTPDTVWLVSFVVKKNGEIVCFYCDNEREDGIGTYFLRIFHEDGTAKKDIYLQTQDDDSFYSNLVVDEKRDLYYLSGENHVYALNDLGNVVFSQKVNGWISDLVKTSENELLCVNIGPSGTAVQYVDVDAQKLGKELKVDIDVDHPSYFFESPVEEHVFYYCNGDGIFAYEPDDTIVKIVEGTNPSLAPQNYSQISALADEQFLVRAYEYLGDGATVFFFLLKQSDKSILSDQQVITFGGIFLNDRIRTKVLRFNQCQTKYRIELVDYGDCDMPYEALKKDFEAGNLPDLIDLSGIDTQAYISKGMLTDLYTLMEEDPEIKKGDFLDNFLKAMETDGKLCHISTHVSLNGMVSSKSNLMQFPIEKIEDLRKLEQQTSGDAKSFYLTTSMGVVDYYCCEAYEHFVDWPSKTCHFNTQQFIDILEYANEYPSEDEVDWNTQQEKSQAELIRRNKLLFMEVSNLQLQDMILYEQAFDDEVQFVGIPSDSSSGMSFVLQDEYGISESSTKKEGAWEFLRTLLTEKSMTEDRADGYYGTLPTRKDAFESVLYWHYVTVPYTDQYGRSIVPLENTLWGFDDMEVDVGPLTHEQMVLLRNTMQQADHLWIYDVDIMDIVSTECAPYFSGQISALEAAQTIQDRVTAYMQ